MHPELIRSETARAVRKTPENLDAWECILRGSWHLGRYSKEQFEQARECLLRALSLDPESVGARSLLAFATHTALLNGWVAEPAEAIEEIARLARQAVSLDPRDADAQVTMGIAHLATQSSIARWPRGSTRPSSTRMQRARTRGSAERSPFTAPRTPLSNTSRPPSS